MKDIRRSAVLAMDTAVKKIFFVLGIVVFLFASLNIVSALPPWKSVCYTAVQDYVTGNSEHVLTLEVIEELCTPCLNSEQTSCEDIFEDFGGSTNEDATNAQNLLEERNRRLLELRENTPRGCDEDSECVAQLGAGFYCNASGDRVVGTGQPTSPIPDDFTTPGVLGIGVNIKAKSGAMVRSFQSISNSSGRGVGGKSGRIWGGPVQSSSGDVFTWWNVNFNDAPDGWVKANDLDYISAGGSPLSTKFTNEQRVLVKNNAGVDVMTTPGRNKLGTQANQSLGKIIGEPEFYALAYVGYIWWNVQFDSGVSGWVKDSFLVDGTGFVPPNQQTNPPTEPVIEIKLNGVVKVIWGGAGVYDGPGPSYNLLGNQENDSRGVIVEGPHIESRGYKWWNVNFTNGTDGWIVENFIKGVSLPECSNNYDCVTKHGIGYDCADDGTCYEVTPKAGVCKEIPDEGEEEEPEEPDTTVYQCGDVNKDGAIDNDDVEKIGAYVFGGETPSNWDIADLDGNGFADAVDVVTLINYVKRQGPLPSCESGVICDRSRCSGSSIPASKYSCGNINMDDKIDLRDTYMLGRIVFENVQPVGWENVDLNDDGVANVLDVVTLVNYVYRDGSAPTCRYVYKCGDLNNDEQFTQADVDKMMSYAFGGENVPVGVNADLNGDGVINVVDVVMEVDVVNRNIINPACVALTSCSGGNCDAIFDSTVEECGNINRDTKIDNNDINRLVDYAFNGVSIPSNVKADLNSDGVVDILDVVILTNYVKRGGVKPVCSSACLPKTCSELGRQCGTPSDGCTTTSLNCGTCNSTSTCNADGKCISNTVTCTSQSQAQTCGTAVCGIKVNNCQQTVNCGTCNSTSTCNEFTGMCNPSYSCVRQCQGKQCGSDGCNGVCGTCQAGYQCNTAAQCEVMAGNRDGTEVKIIDASSGTGADFIYAGQEVKYSVSAEDSQKEQDALIFYNVNWGDGSPVSGLSKNIAVYGGGAEFTHRYSVPGTYTVTITVKDSQNDYAQRAYSMQVVGAPATYTSEVNLNFNEGKFDVAYDKSGRNNNALIGPYYTWVAGKILTGLKSAATIPSSASINAGKYEAEVWIKPLVDFNNPSEWGSTSYITLMDLGSTARIRAMNSQGQFYLSAGSLRVESSEFDWQKNVWYSVKFRYDGARATLTIGGAGSFTKSLDTTSLGTSLTGNAISLGSTSNLIVIDDFKFTNLDGTVINNAPIINTFDCPTSVMVDTAISCKVKATDDSTSYLAFRTTVSDYASSNSVSKPSGTEWTYTYLFTKAHNPHRDRQQTISLTVTDYGGASVSAQRIVTVLWPPNIPPQFSAFSGSTSFEVNEYGTWSINVINPEGPEGPLGGTISWVKINYGDGTALTASSSKSGDKYSFPTHKYTSSGNYVLTFVAQDANGDTNSTSYNFVVYPACGIPIINSTRFNIGTSRVRLNPSGAIYSNGAVPGAFVGYLGPQNGKVVGGPYPKKDCTKPSNNAYRIDWYWKVDYDTGTDGWSREAELTSI